MATITINSVTINNTTFHDNDRITSVDLRGAPWTTNSMYMAFYGCSNLTTVTNINDRVIDMRRTFWLCQKLVTAPIIPNSVTHMSQTFYSCQNLVNAPIIPNSVKNLDTTFAYCGNLVNAPVIPTSVTSMFQTFYTSNNLTGNIFIESNNVSSATGCFSGTLPKNVYIPFTYSNGVNTQTYNSFTSAGYKTDGSVNSVYLKDISTL